MDEQSVSLLFTTLKALIHGVKPVAGWHKGDRPGRVEYHSNGTREIHGIGRKGLYYVCRGKRRPYCAEDVAAGVDVEALSQIFLHWPGIHVELEGKGLRRQTRKVRPTSLGPQRDKCDT